MFARHMCPVKIESISRTIWDLNPLLPSSNDRIMVLLPLREGMRILGEMGRGSSLTSQ
jgi:hypothetical protein